MEYFFFFCHNTHVLHTYSFKTLVFLGYYVNNITWISRHLLMVLPSSGDTKQKKKNSLMNVLNGTHKC